MRGVGGPEKGRGLQELAITALVDAGVGGNRAIALPGAAELLSEGTQVCPLVLGAWHASVATLGSCALAEQRTNLCQVASAGSSLLRACGGSVRTLVGAAGPALFAPHVDLPLVRHYFGNVKVFAHIDRLLRALDPGVPVDVAPGGDLDAELSYGNHPSVLPRQQQIREKIVADVLLGQAVVSDAEFIREVQGVRVSPLGVVDEPKFRIIHDLTFTAGTRSSVNGDTDFSQAPECLLGHVLTDILKRILYLRQMHGVAAEIMLCRIDVKEALRQVVVNPSGASVFAYVFDGVGVVDLRCQFGWRSSPGFWSLFSSALEHSHTRTSFSDVSSDRGRRVRRPTR